MAISPSSFDPAAIFVGPSAIADWLVAAPLALSIGGGVIALLLRGNLRFQGVFALLVLAVLVVANALLLAEVTSNGPRTMMMGRWLAPYGIAFTVDVFGALLNFAASVVVFVVTLSSLKETALIERRHGRLPLILFLMAGVSGALTTGDLFNLYVWFEVLLISTFGLLVLGGRPAQLDGTIKYGFLNLVATTLFLIATGLIYALFGTLNMADLAGRAAAQSSPGNAEIALAALFVVAFAMKAAAFPLNFWLPAAYHTPAPAVSALFAAVLTKVGIYALYRVTVMLLGPLALPLQPALSVIAVLTMITGALGALAESDLRRLAGYLVMSGIGFMLAALALGNADSLTAGIAYAVQSMAAMAALYMVAGRAAEMTGSSRLQAMGGLWKASPVLSMIAIALLASVAGLPPAVGFWPKYALLGAAIKDGASVIAIAILLQSLLIAAVMARIVLFVFWRDGSVSKVPGILPMAGPALLSLLLLAGGLWPEPLLAVSGKAAAGLLDLAAYRLSVPGVGP